MLLQKAGAPHGEQLRGQLMTSYVVAEAQDSYRVSSPWRNSIPGFSIHKFWWRTMDGSARGSVPLRLVDPHEKRSTRWVRMLQTITVVTPEH